MHVSEAWIIAVQLFIPFHSNMGDESTHVQIQNGTMTPHQNMQHILPLGLHYHTLAQMCELV